MSKKPKELPLPSISSIEIDEAMAWLYLHSKELPSGVAEALNFGVEVARRAIKLKTKLSPLLVELKRALGILPSSERQKSGNIVDGLPKDGESKKRSEIEKLVFLRDRAKKLDAWYRKLARRHRGKAGHLDEQIMKLEDFELTDEDNAEIEREGREYDTRLDLGARCDLESARSSESLMCGISGTLDEVPVDAEVDRESLPPGAIVKQQFFDQRERLDFSFSVTKFNINVEKLAITTKDGQRLVSASLDDIGPAKMRVTWNFLANAAILVSQYAMPMNRFAGLVSTKGKRFTAGEMSRYFHYVATRFAPIYIHLGKSLANCAVLGGDDTPSRVIELSKALANPTKNEMPWSEYATIEKALQTLRTSTDNSLGPFIGSHFGFQSDKKDGSGSKRGFNTTVISGRPETLNPRSTVIFYRSHLGGFGNLLDIILKNRDSKNSNLVVQSDLSTTNLISDVNLKNKFSITLAGCAFHARRPFAIYEKNDPDLCANILHHFKGIAIYEDGLDIAGRNAENTLAVRDIDVRAAWEEIKNGAKLATKRWAKDSPLGEGGNYILRNFDRLTYYLSDHRLMPSNNFHERMLRLERLIENNSLFRQTLEGRFSLDIMRTVLQTAIAARVDLIGYLKWVMRMPTDVIAAEPQAFSPLEFARQS